MVRVIMMELQPQADSPDSCGAPVVSCQWALPVVSMLYGSGVSTWSLGPRLAVPASDLRGAAGGRVPFWMFLTGKCDFQKK